MNWWWMEPSYVSGGLLACHRTSAIGDSQQMQSGTLDAILAHLFSRDLVKSGRDKIVPNPDLHGWSAAIVL